MARITLRQLLDHAAENGYGVPAFNVNNMEQVQAIMEAAEATDAPVIMQASARRALVRQRHLAEAPDRRARRDLSAHPDRACTRTTATARPPARARSSTASPA